MAHKKLKNILLNPFVNLIIFTLILVLLGIYQIGPLSFISTKCPSGTTKVMQNNPAGDGLYDYECR